MPMALNNVYMRAVRGKYTPFEITATICTLGFIAFNAATIVYGIFKGNLSDYFAPCHNISFVIATAYLGIFCILFSAQLMAYMQAHMPAMNASLFGNLSTAFSIVIGAVVLGETLHPYHIICTILIITGVIGVSLSASRQKGNLEKLK